MPNGHARGSQGANVGFEIEGGWKPALAAAAAAAAAAVAAAVVVVGDVGCVVVLVGVDAGGLIANWVPVTTVTWAPFVVGACMRVTAPVMECATASAAPMVAGEAYSTRVSSCVASTGVLPVPAPRNPRATNELRVVAA